MNDAKASSQVWDSDIECDAELAERVIAEQFPSLRPMSVSILGEGWDSTAYRVNKTWCFRFPRRKIALPLLDLEAECLPFVARAVSCAIPLPVFIGKPSRIFPYPFLGAKLVSGEELCRTDYDPAGAVDLARELGSELGALHRTTIPGEIRFNLPEDPNARGNPARRAAMVRDRLGIAGSALPRDVSRAVLALCENAEGAGPCRKDERSFVHGDLHPRHVLVTPEGRLSGIIDWGDMCIADTAVDVSLAYASFSHMALTTFFDAYGTGVPRDTELRARMCGASMALWLLLYAADRGDVRLTAAMVASLGRLAGPWG